MTLFMIERQFAEKLQLSSDAVQQIVDLNQEIGVNWLMSFLSADQKKTYCLYEASDANAIREQEKSRVARELHDELAQSLTALKLSVHAAPD